MTKPTRVFPIFLLILVCASCVVGPQDEDDPVIPLSELEAPQIRNGMAINLNGDIITLDSVSGSYSSSRGNIFFSPYSRMKFTGYHGDYRLQVKFIKYERNNGICMPQMINNESLRSAVTISYKKTGFLSSKKFESTEASGEVLVCDNGLSYAPDGTRIVTPEDIQFTATFSGTLVDSVNNKELNVLGRIDNMPFD